MLIRSTLSNPAAFRAPRVAPQKSEEVSVPFKERAVTAAIVGASLGTMAGERLGEVSFIGGAAYAGYALGKMIGKPEIGRIVGAVVGAGAGYLAESKLNIGKTVGGAAGFVSGGIVGGVAGTVIAGVSTLLDANPFK